MDRSRPEPVMLPAEPTQAGLMFLRVMTYPPDQIGRRELRGAQFFRAMLRFRAEAERRIAAELGVSRHPAPLGGRPLSFGALDRGFSHVRRRLVAAQIHAERVSDVLALRPELDHSTPEARAALPPVGKVVARRLSYWEERGRVNNTRRVGSSPEDLHDRVGDIRKRVYRDSEAVLHMAYGLALTLHDLAARGLLPETPMPLDRLALCPQLWADEAITRAIEWRAPHFPYFGRPPSSGMFELRRAKQTPPDAAQSMR